MNDTPVDFRVVVEFEKGAANATGEYVRGWLSVAIDENGKQVEDDQGDRVSIVELEKAAHKFISESRAGKVSHGGKDIGEFVELVIIDDAFAKATGMTSQKRGWWGNLHVLDEATKADVAKGKFKGFSIGGRGVRVTRKVA